MAGGPAALASAGGRRGPFADQDGVGRVPRAASTTERTAIAKDTKAFAVFTFVIGVGFVAFVV